MENKKLILKIALCVGAVVSIVYVFFPVFSMGMSSLSMWSVITDRDADIIFAFISDSEIMGVLMPILMFWLPAALLIAAGIMSFITEKPKLSAVLAFIGAALFLIADIYMIIQEFVYGGVFINLAGVVITSVAAIMLIVTGNAETKDSPVMNNRSDRMPCGKMFCIAGEYAGGVFDILDTIVIGRDAGSANIILSNKKVSRAHCIIKYVPETDTYVIKDTSSNGTYYSDGKRLVKGYEMQVPRGTEIYMGDPKEIFRLD